ncbi:MAG: PAS domain-containing protein [Nitrospirota bacterium]
MTDKKTDIHLAGGNPYKKEIIYRSPVRLLFVLVSSVFIVEAFIMFLLAAFPAISTSMRAFIDATMLIILLFPAIYFFAFRPLLLHISERKKAEDALEHLSRRNKMILESAGEGIFGLDADGKVTFVNPAAARMLGYDVEELIGEGHHAKVHYSHSDGKPYPKEECPIYEAYKDGAVHYGREVFWKRDGTPLPIEYVSTPIRENGELKGTVVVFNNITEKKKAEEALRRSEEEKRIILDTMSELMSYRDKDMRIIWANRAFIEHVGLTQNEIKSKYCYEVIHKRSTPCPDCPIHMKILESGRSQEAEIALPDGRILLVRGYPVRDKGNIIGIVEISTDITKRKRIEEEVRIMKQQMEFILGATKTGLDIIDSSLNIVYIDPEWQKVYGGPAGKKCYEYFMGRSEVCPGCGVLKALETKSIIVSEEVLVKEGNRPIQVTTIPFQNEKGEWLVAEVNVDITDRKKWEKALRESEEKLNAMLRAIGDPIIMMNRDLDIIWANDIAMKVFGEDFVGKKCNELFVREQYKTHPCLTFETFQDGKVHEEEIKMTDKDGREKYFHCTANVALKDKKGNPTTVIEIFRDITEGKRLEDQLLQAQKMEAIGQLAGGVAHDFNNILTAIIGFGNLMQMEMKKDNPSRIYVTQILNSAQRAANLTQALLAFSRKQIINPKPVNLNDIIKILEKLLSRVIGEDIELSINLTDTDLITMADSTQMEQVLINLATNARDAMPDGGRLIISTELVEIDPEFIKTHAYGRTGRYALISIEDTGIGMDEKTRERIFEPFFTTKEVGKGTGLGLAMVYGIVKQHRGYINVYSEPGKGTTFKIYIPLIKTLIEEEKPQELFLITGGTETILVAEDDAQVRELTKNLLGGFGYNVLEAVDGEDTLRVFNENKDKVDLLILDVVMPKMNGKEVYDEIRKIRPDIQAIFMSGYSADIIHKKGILDEGLEFILKPITPHVFLRKIRETLNKR